MGLVDCSGGGNTGRTGLVGVGSHVNEGGLVYVRNMGGHMYEENQ